MDRYDVRYAWRRAALKNGGAVRMKIFGLTGVGCADGVEVEQRCVFRIWRISWRVVSEIFKNC